MCECVWTTWRCVFVLLLFIPQLWWVDLIYLAIQNILLSVSFVQVICCNLGPSPPPQEIPLSEILQVEQCRDYSNLAQGSNPHCFEIITATMVYYVGENNGSHYHSPALAASGVGMEVAQGWEKAIRQALMPVTPQPSVASAAGQGKDHSK